MGQPTVDPKVKFVSHSVKRKWQICPGGERTSESLQKFRTKLRTRIRKLREGKRHNESTQTSARQKQTFRVFLSAVLCLFCSPPLDLCSSFVTPPNESAAVLHAAVSAPLSETSAIISLPCYGGDEGVHIWVFDIWRDPWHSRRCRRIWSLMRFGSANSKVAAGRKGCEAESRGENLNPREALDSSGVIVDTLRRLWHFFFFYM